MTRKTMPKSSSSPEENVEAPSGCRLRKSVDSLAHEVQEAGKSQNVARILSVERMFLEHEFHSLVIDDEKRHQIEQTLRDLEIAARHVACVSNPDNYLPIVRGYAREMGHAGGLPMDEARKFFRKHALQLTKRRRTDLSEEEKRTLDNRKNNMRMADVLYERLQRKALKALGIKEKTKKGSVEALLG